jgi:hypothetical protein
MNCAACEKRLSEHVGGELDGRTSALVRAHVDACGSCRRALEEMEATVRLLRRAGNASPPEGFASELHRRLVAAGAPPQPGLMARLRQLAALRPLLWATAGAGVAAVLAVAVARQHPSAPPAAPSLAAPAGEIAVGPVAPTFRVPAARLAAVKIDFVAEQPVDDVAFAVALPEGLRFVSGGKELPDRRFSWRGPLVEGSNPIPFTVRGARAGRYTIQARAVGDGVDATHEVVLEVTKG